MWLVGFKIYKQFQWRVSSRAIQTTTGLQHDSLFVHRDTPEDNPNIPFEFTPENNKVQSTNLNENIVYISIYC